MSEGFRIDTELGISRFGGKRERYFKSLLKFAGGLPGEKLRCGDPEAVRAAHTIKGVAGNLGINELYERAAACEQSLKSDTPSEALVNDFYELCAAYGRWIQDEFGGELAEEQQASDIGDASEYARLIGRLRTALTMCDPNECEKTAELLKAKQWPDAVDIKRVCALVENYEYDEALALLGRGRE